MNTLKHKVMILIMCLVFAFSGCIMAYADTEGDNTGQVTEVDKENVTATTRAGTITGSDHWVLPILRLNTGLNADLYSGAEGYTISSTYHRTSIEYLVCWQSAKVVRKWGTGKVQASTGYVRPPYSNLRNAFKSALYYEF
ncbi:hypothetical protein M2140_000186 [Clostridiales Family XIII bacterium PM5-7]